MMANLMLCVHPQVVVNYSSSAGAAEEVASAIKAAGGDAMIVAANVGKREDIDRMFKEVTDKWGRVDVLVNNAGECACCYKQTL